MRKHFLDGIRGWASVMVVLAHVLRGIAIPAAPSYDKKFLLFVSDGTLAVYIFFVVSGFALSAAYFETGKSKLLTNTALRRYPRLTLPIFLSSFLAFLVLQFGLVFSHQAAVFANSAFWLGTFFNFLPSFSDFLRFSLFDVYFNYDGTRTYNPALWTMSIELSGSMFVLGFLAVFGTVRRVPVYFVAMLIFCLLKSPLLSFVFGMILSELFTRTPKPRLSHKSIINLISCVAIIFTIGFSTFGGQFYGDPDFFLSRRFSSSFHSHKLISHGLF
jgi:peptidoglycan/LPS O-acetylase OafA/YrhL